MPRTLKPRPDISPVRRVYLPRQRLWWCRRRERAVERGRRVVKRARRIWTQPLWGCENFGTRTQGSSPDDRKRARNPGLEDTIPLGLNRALFQNKKILPGS